MPKKNFPAVVLLAPVIFAGATCLAQTKAEKAPYPAMASPGSVFGAGRGFRNRAGAQCCSTIHFGRSRSDGTRKEGYTTAVKGSNGFLCLVERSWGAATDEPILESQSACAQSALIRQPQGPLLPIFLMKTKLVLAGKSKAEIAPAIALRWITRNCPRWSPERCAT